mmetsp:Transcript_44207/g.89295  ORF Transcript_44207/g.89295 Transcript_44207/m.89295 type:complete len:241 (-) Transcript_44207:310-1032(-)
MHQRQEAVVEIPLHLVERQIIGVVSKRLIYLHGYEDQAPNGEGQAEAPHTSGGLRFYKLTGDYRSGHPMDDEHDGDQLCVGEWEGNLLDLAHVVQVHDAPGELLEGARQERRGDLEDVAFGGVHDQPLDPLQKNLAAVIALPHEGQTVRLHALGLDDLEAVVVEVADLLEGRAVEHADEADEGVLEGLHLRLALFGAIAEGEEAADGVEPLPADLVDQRSALPEARVRLAVAEDDEETKD